jgi:hypothetical protein
MDDDKSAIVSMYKSNKGHSMVVEHPVRRSKKIPK